MAKRRRNRGSFPCPHCGADVPTGAKFCRHCGASEGSGWGDDDTGAEVDGGYGGDDDFDYDEFVRREFPEQAEGARNPSVVGIVALLCIAAMVLGLLVWAMEAGP